VAESRDIPSDDDGFARRWSRLKQESREHDAAVPPTPQQDPVADGVVAEPIDPADLPDVDSLDADSDYTPFLRDGVPDDIRNMALRKLWRSDAVFANLDGLNDYDEDFGAILKAGQAFMEKLAAAAESAAEAGGDGPRYPTATYAEAEAVEEAVEETVESDTPHPPGAYSDRERTATAGEDDDKRTA
jgi:hypothetical protein